MNNLRNIKCSCCGKWFIVDDEYSYSMCEKCLESDYLANYYDDEDD